MAARDEQRTSPLAKVLLTGLAVGVVGVIVLLIVGMTHPGVMTGWLFALLIAFFAVAVGTPYALACVPEEPRNAYVACVQTRATSIAEFLDDEAAGSQMRRAVVRTAFWLTGAGWVTCYAALIIITVVMSSHLDSTPDSAVVSALMTIGAVGTAAVLAFSVLGVLQSRVTVDGPHMRALQNALPGVFVRRNRTSAGLSDMVKNTAPGARARSGGFGYSYITVTDSELAVWSAGRGYLTRIVDVPLASITGTDAGPIDLRFGSSPGLIVRTTALTLPLELGPVDRFVDFKSSAERLALVLRDRMS